MCVCVCMRACVCVCMRVCVHICLDLLVHLQQTSAHVCSTAVSLKQNSAMKRRLSEGEDEECVGGMEVEGEEEKSQQTKRSRGLQTMKENGRATDRLPSFNHPLPGETRMPCLVKVSV